MTTQPPEHDEAAVRNLLQGLTVEQFNTVTRLLDHLRVTYGEGSIDLSAVVATIKLIPKRLLSRVAAVQRPILTPDPISSSRRARAFELYAIDGTADSYEAAYEIAEAEFPDDSDDTAEGHDDAAIPEPQARSRTTIPTTDERGLERNASPLVRALRDRGRASR